MSEKNKKVSKRVFWTRIVCLALALIMIGSVCYLAIQLIFEASLEKKQNTADNRTFISSLCSAESFEYENGESV